MEENKQVKVPANESLDDLYKRVHKKCYKILRYNAMEIKIADEVIKEVGVRPGNIIGQQTAAATTIIRSHKLRDSNNISVRASEIAARLEEINKTSTAERKTA